MRSKLSGIAIATLILLTSCAAPARRTARPSSPSEIVDHPAILHDHSVPIDQMRLWGVRLGDPTTAIRDERIIDRGLGGWIMCRDGNRYRTEEGSVTTLGVWDARTLAKLRINSPGDIEARFGKPEKVDDADPVIIYRYQGGKVSVLWNKRETQINAVNITK